MVEPTPLLPIAGCSVGHGTLGACVAGLAAHDHDRLCRHLCLEPQGPALMSLATETPPRLPLARDVVPSPLHVAATCALLLLTPCIPRHHVVTVACPCHARVHATHYSLHPRCRTCAATPRSRTLYMSSPFVRVCRVYCFARVV